MNYFMRRPYRQTKSLKNVIRENREFIDSVILAQVPGNRCNDRERELWIRNDEGLYQWAMDQGWGG